jgi:hypothetical protein
MFLTDGMDDSSQETAEVSQHLKALIKEKKIKAQFNILAIDSEVDAEQLENISNIGTERGSFSFFDSDIRFYKNEILTTIEDT